MSSPFEWGGWPFVIGLAAAALIPTLAQPFGGIFSLLKTSDGKHLSTARCQFAMWTASVLFAYAYLNTLHIQSGHTWTKSPQMPQDILLLMGLSITTTAVSIVQEKKSTESVRNGHANWKDLVTNHAQPNQSPSLPKVQMLAWTLVGMVGYIVTTLHMGCTFWSATATMYPDVDPALTALVGLGQGAFVANRFVDPESGG